jgi:hypothetical protein
MNLDVGHFWKKWWREPLQDSAVLSVEGIVLRSVPAVGVARYYTSVRRSKIDYLTGKDRWAIPICLHPLGTVSFVVAYYLELHLSGYMMSCTASQFLGFCVVLQLTASLWYRED